MKKIILASMLASACSLSFAEGLIKETYVGLSVSDLSAKTVLGDADLGNFTGLLAGVKFNDYVGAEVRVLESKSYNYADANVQGNLRIKPYSSVSMVGFVPLQSGFSLYGTGGVGFGRIGATGTDLTTGNSITYNESKSSFTYGAGLQFSDSNWNMRLGYVNFFKDSNGRIDGVDLSVSYSFK